MFLYKSLQQDQGSVHYILSWHSNCFSVSMSNRPGDITGNVFFLVTNLPHLLYNVTLSFFSNLKRLVHMLLVQQNPLWLQEKIRSLSLSCPNFIGVSCMYSLYLFYILYVYIWIIIRELTFVCMFHQGFFLFLIKVS